MTAAVECRDLRKTYDGKVEAVRGLSLLIEPGECFGLLGPNGAGKTTTIEILEGLLEPTSGEVSILGRSWKTHSRELREDIGISLQETRLSEKLTVRETIELFASFYTQPRSTHEVLSALQLNEKSEALVGNLSGGQKQRLAVATALVASPRVLFLDEPTTGLDPITAAAINALIIEQVRRLGCTAVSITHDLASARTIGDEIVLLNAGRIVWRGGPDELDTTDDPRVRQFVDGRADGPLTRPG